MATGASGTQSIVVTGSSGTVGTAVMRGLLDSGHDAIGVDEAPSRWSNRVDERSIELDLTDKMEFGRLPEDVDLIVHLAANARVFKLVQNPALAKENFDVTFNVLEYARSVDADVIFASSREVYGNHAQIVHSETETLVSECESPYTASKLGGEALVKSYEQCYDIETCILRFSNVYGRYDASDRVIPLFIAQASNGQDLTVYGETKMLDFTYIDDCISGIQQIVQKFHRAKGETFNIASGKATSLVEAATTIRDTLEADIAVTIDSNRPGEVERFVADLSKAEKLIDYEPQYSFEEGLARTVEWYRDHHHLYDEILN